MKIDNELLDTQVFELNLTTMGFRFKKDENGVYKLAHPNTLDMEEINFEGYNLAGKMKLLIGSKIFEQVTR